MSKISEEDTSKKKKTQLKGDVSWPSCLLTKICSFLCWELHYVYSVLSATPTPSLGHENQTGRRLCEPKVSTVYRFLNHHWRRQLCSGLQSSDPELLTQGKWQARALLAQLSPALGQSYPKTWLISSLYSTVLSYIKSMRSITENRYVESSKLL